MSTAKPKNLPESVKALVLSLATNSTVRQISRGSTS